MIVEACLKPRRATGANDEGDANPDNGNGGNASEAGSVCTTACGDDFDCFDDFSFYDSCDVPEQGNLGVPDEWDDCN